LALALLALNASKIVTYFAVESICTKRILVTSNTIILLTLFYKYTKKYNYTLVIYRIFEHTLLTKVY
jgi:hypothetical protein